MTKITPELIKMLKELEEKFPSPLKTFIVSTNDELDKLANEMETKGMRMASISNAGLEHPKRRVSFLPESAFNNNKE